jgi:hypothetical protein
MNLLSLSRLSLSLSLSLSLVSLSPVSLVPFDVFRVRVPFSAVVLHVRMRSRTRKQDTVYFWTTCPLSLAFGRVIFPDWSCSAQQLSPRLLKHNTACGSPR